MFDLLTKTGNIVNAGFSFSISSLTGKVTGRWMPVNLGVELTSYCNLRCPECHSGSGMITRPKGNMKTGLYERILKELGPYLVNINLYFQGEPMMHPEFTDFIRMSAGYNTTVSTNGHFLDRDISSFLAASGLGKIIISLDGMDPDTYGYYRHGGNFAKVMEGIGILLEAVKRNRSRLKIELQFLVNRANEKQIDDARSFARKTGAELRLKSMQVMNAEDYEKWLPENSLYSRYNLENGRAVIKNSLKNRCFRLWIHPVITWDGKVVPCCFDKDADYVMGDLEVSSFRDIWFGEKYMNFRKRILSDRRRTDICRNCTSGLKLKH